jgi:hypothetical protein
MRSAAVIVLVLLSWRAGAARADDASLPPMSLLGGRVLDATHGGPVEGALVMIAGTEGLVRTVTTDVAGGYGALVAPGTYRLVFVHGDSRTSGHVTVEPGRPAVLDGRVDSVAGEVIIIRDRLESPVPPKATNFVASKAPPYSDRAVLADAWTKAWLLLDLDEQGKLRRFKFLRRPGYDLERIAVSEIRKLRFEPGRDGAGRPVRTWLLWSIEWPSAWWLSQFTGTRSAMPQLVGFPPVRQDASVPCAGSGPWMLSSVHPVYKDCSRPDLTKIGTEPWLLP